jgi:hypothetical protein
MPKAWLAALKRVPMKEIELLARLGPLSAVPSERVSER